MDITPNKNISVFSFPLPIYTSFHIGTALDNQNEKYDVFVGLEKKYVKQLKELSLAEDDIDLQNNTGDRKRFGEGSYEEWYTKNRTPFVLINSTTDKMAALIWFGPKTLGKKSIKFGAEGEDKIQKDWHTMVWRSYPPFRGRGIMKDFTLFVMDIYKKQFPRIGFWAGMDSNNKSMIALSSKLGFKLDKKTSDPDANWLVVIKGKDIDIEDINNCDK